MKTPMWMRPCAALALAFLLGSAFARAQNNDSMLLPDRIVLKEDALLPTGVASREFQGYVLEETPESYRVETSARRGISAIVTVFKNTVEKLERGDASIREYQMLKPKLEVSQVSLEVRIYHDQILKPVDEYLSRFPQSAHAGELKAFRGSIEREIDRVENGWFRVGGYWFQPEQLPASALPDWKLFLSLRDEGMQMATADLSRAMQKVESTKNNFLYPQTVVMVRGIMARRMEVTRQFLTAAQIDMDEAKARDLEKQLDAEGDLLKKLAAVDVAEKVRGLDHLQKAKEALQGDTVDLETFKSEYQASKEYWPDLKDREGILLAVLRSRAVKLAEAFGDETLQASSSGASGLRQVLELLRDKDEKLLKELQDLETKAKARHYELEVERLVKEGNLREALVVFGKLKASKARAANELSRLEKDLIALEYEQTKVQLRKLKEAGDRDGMLSALEQAHAFVKSRETDPQASVFLGNETAGLAKEAAGQFDLYTAAQAAFLAQKIAPEQTLVKTVYWTTLTVLGLLVVGVLVVLLLFYASFDNILHQWRYRLRLKALREDGKSRTAGRRKGIKRSK